MTDSLPSIEVQKFIEHFKSIYLKPYRINFEHDGRARQFDLALRHSSVAILLYHTEKKQFLIVRQFRPAIFVSSIIKLPENQGKDINDIDWNSYDREIGCTQELCAGIIDKDLPFLEIAREEIEEECGYSVRTSDIAHIASYIVGMDESGSPQHLYYAQIDESKKISDGGGNVHEGEFIIKVWMTEDEARAKLNSFDGSSPPGFLYALQWWFNRQKHDIPFTHQEEFVNWPLDPSVFPKGKMDRISDLKFTPDPPTNRFHPMRMLYKINGIEKSWDLAPCENSTGVVLYDRKRDEIILNQRFRPAAFIGRTRNQPENKGKDLTTLDWSQYPIEWAYTLELCSGHLKTRDETRTACAVRNVAAKGGYRIGEERLIRIGKAIMGISQGGDDIEVFFAEVTDEDAITDFKPFEDVIPIRLTREAAASVLQAKQSPGSPAIHFAVRWFLNYS